METKKLNKPTVKNTKSRKKWTFKAISGFAHLWLGLVSGIIVLIVSLTGAIYVFEKEIRGVTQPWLYVQPASVKVLPPSALVKIAEWPLGDMKPTSVTYGKADEAAAVSSFNRKKGLFVRVFIDPYNGKVLKLSRLNRKGGGDFDFFRFILNGHRALWLPYEIGHIIVGVSILIFVVMLLSGLVLWWPQKWIKSIRDKSFKIKWKASFKRVNYDLHNVFGFYSCLFLLIIAFTGLVWSFDWFSKSLYWATSGGRHLTAEKPIASDTTKNVSFTLASVDKLWTTISLNDKPEGFFINLPKKRADVIEIVAYLRSGTYYKTNVYQFDQFSLKALSNTGLFSGKYADASIGDKLRRMNYDIHIGAILGIPGKILALFLALISASLPVTGFYIWWGKRAKKNAPQKHKKLASASAPVARPALRFKQNKTQAVE